MGLRFRIEHANWLALLFQPAGTFLPPLTAEARQDIADFLLEIEHHYSKGPGTELARVARTAALAVASDAEDARDAFEHMAMHFRKARWVALLIGSGERDAVDDLFVSREFLDHLVHDADDSNDDGWILQLTEIPQRQVLLDFVSHAFRVALNASDAWPGVLVWTAQGDAVFFECPGDVKAVRDRVEKLIAALGRGTPLRGSELDRSHPSNTLTLLHLSDLHLGSGVAETRILRVQQLVRLFIDEQRAHTTLVPVITGDLMDTPTPTNRARTQNFLDFLRDRDVERPIAILGNHDVKTDGYRGDDLHEALSLPRESIIAYPDQRVALVCFDSNRGGHLARGEIGEAQRIDRGNELDQKALRGFTQIALLHHHPIPIDMRAWQHKEWTEKWFGKWFDRTMVLRDAPAFVKWLETRGVAAALHGHKHIPRFEVQKGVAYIGCGSSTGKVPDSSEGLTYMSVNLVTIDVVRRRITCRLRAERLAGAGTEETRHESMFRAPMSETG